MTRRAFIAGIAIIAITSTLAIGFFGFNAFIVKFINRYTWYVDIKNDLFNRLCLSSSINANPAMPFDRRTTIIYILGGSQDSMTHKIEVAASLCKRNDLKVLILNEPGITSYSRQLRRNLTNDEWKTEEFAKHQLDKRNLEFVSLEPGFFGTLREAKGITEYVSKRQYKNLILVTSPFHTMRSYLTFQHFNKPKMFDIYVYADNYKVGLKYMLLEYLKLNIYKSLLIN